MSQKTLFAASAAAALACTVAVGAQTSPYQKDTKSPKGETITVAGCVQKETDVLKHNAMTGSVGMGDEFVLTNATLKTGAIDEPKPSTDTTTAPKQPAGTSGTASEGDKVYRVTGDKEKELKPYVGQRVEIVGTFKHPEDAARETAGTSGRTSGERTASNTPEITIQSIRPVSGSCSAPVR